MKKVLFIIPILLGFAWVAQANVSFDNTNAMQFLGTTGSFSGSYTVNATSNLAIFACVPYMGSNATITAITYGGNNMTLVGSPEDANSSYSSIWYLLNAPTGTQTLSITATSSALMRLFANVTAFGGVNQSTPIRSGTYATANSSSIALSSNSSDLTMSCFGTIAISGGINGTNQTLDGNTSSSIYQAANDHATVAASNETHTWSVAGAISGDNSIAGFSIQAAGGGTCTANAMTLDNTSYIAAINTTTSITMTASSTGAGVCTSTLESNYSGSYAIIPATGASIDCSGNTCSSNSSPVTENVGCDSIGTYNIQGSLQGTSNSVNSATSTLTCVAPFSAVGLLGQGSYASDTVNWPTAGINAQGFSSVSSLALDPVNHRLFVADKNNARILVFPLSNANTVTTTTAQNVLGACNFTTAGAGGSPTFTVSSSTFGSVNFNLAYDSQNQRLFVSDAGNNRVLGFNVATSSIANCEGATFVLGQSSFTAGGVGNTQNTLHTTDDVGYDASNTRLFVSDEVNNRVMAFSVPANATSGINGENALFVLGQPNFTSSSTALTSSTIGNPTGESYDPIGGRLFVSDYGNNRVMVFSVSANATSGINGEGAINVLGQPNFTSSSTVTTQSGLANPDDNFYDPARGDLFVGDRFNNRVMVFDASTADISNGENAQNLIGQILWTLNGFTHYSSSTFNFPDAASNAFDTVNNVFYQYEGFQNRVTQMSMIHITTASVPAGTVGSSYSQTVNVTSTQGSSQTFSVSSGSLPPGISLNSATGIISGTPASAGTYSFTVQADDNFTGLGYFLDRASYSISIAGTPGFSFWQGILNVAGGILTF